MRKLMLIAAVSAVTLSAGLLDRANAVPLGNPAGIRPAIDAVDVTDQVHCVPGWPHHRFRPYNGCAVARAPVVVVRPAYRTRYWYRGGWRWR